MSMASLLGYTGHMMRLSVKASMANAVMFWTLNGMMLVQNMIMFAVWFIYFANFSNLRGWTVEDLATLYGMACVGYGVSFLLCGGAIDIARAILHGELDVYLAQPRHPLFGLLFRESRMAGLGDIVTGYLLWIWIAGFGPGEILMLTVMAGFAALLVLATAIIINCLPFFLPQGTKMTDRLFEAFILLSTYPQNGFGLPVKVLLLTVIPAGFIAFLPVEVMRTQDFGLMLVVCGVSAVYFAGAVGIFELGLRRYTSGNNMVTRR